MAQPVAAVLIAGVLPKFPWSNTGHHVAIDARGALWRALQAITGTHGFHGVVRPRRRSRRENPASSALGIVQTKTLN
jgi:hypothetical protein